MAIKDGSVGGHKLERGTYRQQHVEFVARRIIVKMKRSAARNVETGAALQELARSVASSEGAQLFRPPASSGRMVMVVPEGENTLDAVARFDARDDVEYAEPDVIDRAQIVPNDPRYVDQYAPKLVGAEAAWDLETGKSNVVIGIIDSGISMNASGPDHEDLNTPGRFVLGTDFVDGGTPRDLNGHGTHVAGIAAALGNSGRGVAGMNWTSPVYICRTLDANGNGSSADFADAVEEITDYAVARGLKAVINYSGGGGENQTKRDACQYASDNGMLVVAATGNDGAGPVIWPAAYSTTITGVVAVGSTTSTDTVSGFSNVGPEVTVVAPGSNILSTTPTYAVSPSLPLNYGTMSGTSMATPLVTGLAALMWSRHPGHTNAKVKQCLKDTAVELGAGNFDNSWGFGRVDALAAVKCGDLIVPQSTLILCKTTLAGCQIVTSALITCGPKSTLCPTTRLTCPSKLPNLCPSTRLATCKSNLILCDGPSTLIGCDVKSALAICPSAIDACPSAPAGCFDPRTKLLARINLLEARLAQLESEAWSNAADRPASVEQDTWYYFDDNNDLHHV